MKTSLRIVGACIVFCALTAPLAAGVQFLFGQGADSRWSSASELHAYFLNRFLISPGNGFSRTSAPAMLIYPTMRLIIECDPPSKSKALVAGEYKIDTLELIGIAKHSPPVVFKANGHDCCFSDIRPLTAFEQESLDAFPRARDAFSQMNGSGNGGQIVGPIAAESACLRCHSGYKVGDVLGALSYRVTLLDRPAAPTRPKTN